MVRLATIDRYVAYRISRPLLALCAITMILLSLENLPRLLKMLDGVQQPLPALGRFMIALVPEYLAFGLLVGGFLATALALRAMALASELDACWAAGMSPMRVMRVPMLAGLLLACVHLGVRGFAEPWSERQLDRIGLEARTGELGFSVRAGELRRLSADTVLLADHVDRDTGLLGDVFVRSPGVTMTAHSAFLRNGGRQGMTLNLEDGTMLRDGGSVHFQVLHLPLRDPMQRSPFPSSMDQADRATLPMLLAIAQGHLSHSGLSRRGAAAVLAERMAQAGLTLLGPWLAFALAVPPRRRASAIGLGIGTCLIVGFVEAGDALATSAPPIAQAALLTAFVLLSAALLSWQHRAGYDVVEDRLNRLWLRLRRRHSSAEASVEHLRHDPPAMRLDLAA